MDINAEMPFLNSSQTLLNEESNLSEEENFDFA